MPVVARIDVPTEVLPSFVALPACLAGYVAGTDPQDFRTQERAIAGESVVDTVEHHDVDGLGTHRTREKVTQRHARTVNAGANVRAVPSAFVQAVSGHAIRGRRSHDSQCKETTANIMINLCFVIRFSYFASLVVVNVPSTSGNISFLR